MPTKTTAKKTRKPTQLDRIETALTFLSVEVQAIRHALPPMNLDFRTANPSAPKPKGPEPWVPMVGDWVVLVGKGDTDRSGWLEQFYQAIGSILRVDGLSKDTKDAIHATINGEDWDFDFEWLRPATQSEIDAHLEAEAKPIPFGTRVKVKGADSDGIYWYASGDKHHFVCDFVGLLIAPRNGITVIPTEP